MQTAGKQGEHQRFRSPPELLMLASVAAVGWLALWHWQGSFGFYEDEGFNLIKADLVARGYRLYRDIYSDQAPLYTWLLAAPLRFGLGHQAVQLVPPLFGAATLAAAFVLARTFAGRAAGLLTAVVLLCWAPFLKFSSTIVVNTPALALACWSLVCAHSPWGPRSRATLLASGLLLGAAVTMKLATLYFLPVAVAAVLWGIPGNETRPPWRALGPWLAGLLVPLVVVLPLVPVPEMLSQLIVPHTTGLEQFAQDSARNRQRLLGSPGFLLVLGSTGAGLLALWLVGARRSLAILGPWLGIALAWVLFHRPLWTHHFPDLLLPVTIASCTGTVAGLRPGGATGVHARFRSCFPGPCWPWASCCTRATTATGAWFTGTLRWPICTRSPASSPPAPAARTGSSSTARCWPFSPAGPCHPGWPSSCASAWPADS
jgi:hypothetical protein